MKSLRWLFPAAGLLALAGAVSPAWSQQPLYRTDPPLYDNSNGAKPSAQEDEAEAKKNGTEEKGEKEEEEKELSNLTLGNLFSAG